MRTDFASLSHSFRTACQASGIKLPLGHAHQLLASAFGYRSLAAFQASTEEPASVPNGVHLILDIPALQERGAALDLGAADCEKIPRLLGAAFASKMTWGGIHPSEIGFFDFLHTRLQDAVLNADEVVRHTAVMNSDGLAEVYLPFDFELADLPAVGETLELPVSGLVRMRPDKDRPYRGEQVDVEAVISMERRGRRLVGDVRMQVVQAEPDRGERARDMFNGDRMSITEARAYGELLDLDLRLVEQLDNIEVTESTGSNGDGSYGHSIEFAGAGPENIINIIRKKHGTTLFHVGPGFFDDGAEQLEQEDHEYWTQRALDKIRECVSKGPGNCSASSTELIMVAFATRRTCEWLQPPVSEHPAMWDRLDSVQCEAVRLYQVESGML